MLQDIRTRGATQIDLPVTDGHDGITAIFGTPHAVRCVLEFFGPRHVLFGTDMPLGPENSVEETIADIDTAGPSREDMAAVYAGNAVRLLGELSG